MPYHSQHCRTPPPDVDAPPSRGATAGARPLLTKADELASVLRQPNHGAHHGGDVGRAYIHSSSCSITVSRVRIDSPQPPPPTPLTPGMVHVVWHDGAGELELLVLVEERSPMLEVVGH
jgi:hypothetical protein